MSSSQINSESAIRSIAMIILSNSNLKNNHTKVFTTSLKGERGISLSCTEGNPKIPKKNAAAPVRHYNKRSPSYFIKREQ